MAIVSVRTHQTSPTIHPAPVWEPFDLMREMLEWDPFRETTPRPRWQAEVFVPHLDVKESSDGFLFKADLPGLEERDVEVTLTGSELTIKGRREADQQNQGETYYTCERRHGAFNRTFTLPEGIDANRIEAELKHGVLTVFVPKTPELKPRTISVRTGGDKIRLFENKEAATA